MKTLFLVRHAKSSWDDASLTDKDRPLDDRGLRDAPKMGQRLHERGVKVDLLLASPAVRALTTARIIAKQLNYKVNDITLEDRLYPGLPAELLEIIHKLDKKLARVMLVAHNPALTELAHRFSREITKMPTCSIAEFIFDTMSWSNIGRHTLVHATLDYPKKS